MAPVPGKIVLPDPVVRHYLAKSSPRLTLPPNSDTKDTQALLQSRALRLIPGKDHRRQGA